MSIYCTALSKRCCTYVCLLCVVTCHCEHLAMDCRRCYTLRYNVYYNNCVNRARRFKRQSDFHGNLWCGKRFRSIITTKAPRNGRHDLLQTYVRYNIRQNTSYTERDDVSTGTISTCTSANNNYNIISPRAQTTRFDRTCPPHHRPVHG